MSHNWGQRQGTTSSQNPPCINLQVSMCTRMKVTSPYEAMSCNVGLQLNHEIRKNSIMYEEHRQLHVYITGTKHNTNGFLPSTNAVSTKD